VKKRLGSRWTWLKISSRRSRIARWPVRFITYR
jgi:hypothetical protein